MEISIIIAVHNCEKYLGRAIRSALAQTFPKEQYEIVVVNDGSTDGTEKILDSFKGIVKVITFKKNKGLAYARNYAIKNALGKFVICLDADDYISIHLLNIEHLYLTHNSFIDAVSCDYFVVNDKEEPMLRRNAVNDPIACGIMFYKDKLREVGLYDEKFLALEDLDLRKRYLEKFNIYNIPLPLYRYRDHEESLTKKKEHMEFYKRKLHEKHKIKDLHSHLKNHKNVKAGLGKCC
jgi:glycosyltransferase involved in cell wall biosynthesis